MTSKTAEEIAKDIYEKVDELNKLTSSLPIYCTCNFDIIMQSFVVRGSIEILTAKVSKQL